MITKFDHRITRIPSHQASTQSPPDNAAPTKAGAAIAAVAVRLLAFPGSNQNIGSIDLYRSLTNTLNLRELVHTCERVRSPCDIPRSLSLWISRRPFNSADMVSASAVFTLTGPANDTLAPASDKATTTIISLILNIGKLLIWVSDNGTRRSIGRLRPSDR